MSPRLATIAIGIGLSAPVLCTAAPDEHAAAGFYARICAVCHGPGGDGKGPAGVALNPKPANFTDATRMAKRSDAELVQVILDGGQAAGLSPLMPPFRDSVSEADAAAIVALLRSFAAR
mgnify:CR=1 FL=1